MTNKSKNIGTAGETAVVRFLAANGFPHAERRALCGNHDFGDVTGTPGLCWEVKAGHAAERCAGADLRAWQDQTDIETRNSKADIGILVLKRKGVGADNAGQWWAYLRAWDLAQCIAGGVLIVEQTAPNPYVRVLLKEAVRVLRHAGYGDPLEDAAA